MEKISCRTDLGNEKKRTVLFSVRHLDINYYRNKIYQYHNCNVENYMLYSQSGAENRKVAPRTHSKEYFSRFLVMTSWIFAPPRRLTATLRIHVNTWHDSATIGITWLTGVEVLMLCFILMKDTLNQYLIK